ncbi:14367_t:CDS:1 [Acaulospora colombiana]|uniref:14367_t:CDS:1 n=1 Tax=Acaulospora colombiana TaxID=27376 RepID=A0ACA9JWI3_9GLOM|nr:14367_t:CDS:1 [Acaulospora colombiana]
MSKSKGHEIRFHNFTKSADLRPLTDDELLLKVALNIHDEDVKSVRKLLPWKTENELANMIIDVYPETREIPELNFLSRPRLPVPPSGTPEYRDWLMEAQWSPDEENIYKEITDNGRRGLKDWRELIRRLNGKNLSDIIRHFATLKI